MGKVKSSKQIDAIRKSCRMLAELMQEVGDKIRPGVTTLELENFAKSWIDKHQAVPSFLGWQGYPYATCMSVNECLIHGVPNTRPLEEGDTLGVDMGMIVDGGYSDHAYTFPVGKVDENVAKLLEVTRDSLYQAIEALKPGKRVVEVGRAVEKAVKPYGYGIVREYCGHGVGENVWEEPQIPNYVGNRAGPRVRANMVVAIEPMINMGTEEIEVLDDEWSVVTKDRQQGVHYEHTVLLRPEGNEILTRWADE